MILIAMGGDDPQAAVGFWQRMAAQGGGGIPEFLSSHPADESRINEIRTNIQDALQYYQPGS
jgi:predicted Zn-dependent protease